MTVDIIYPGSTSGSENYSSEPPLGPIALYSALPDAIRPNVRFLDSTLMTDAELEVAIRSRHADVTAFSCTTFNYSRAVRLADLAKQQDSIVVLGGIHVTFLRDAILRRMETGDRPIDYLVTGAGEPAFGKLLTALSMNAELGHIPNLSGIGSAGIFVNDRITSRFGADPLDRPLNYELIDFGAYSSKFQRIGNLSAVRRVAPVFSQRGCAYSGGRKCTFCSIEEINPKRSPVVFERDLFGLLTDNQIDHVRLNDGDFTVNTRHMAKMASAARRAFDQSGVEPVLHCFARADEVDSTRLDLLEKMNVGSVFIGYESGSDQMLASMHKYTTSQKNLEATRMLRERGIDVVCGGMVLGAEGEDERTLSETLRFADQLAAIGNTRSLVATPFIPLPGSPSFGTLLDKLALHSPQDAKRLGDADDFDIMELVELWNRYMCMVPTTRLFQVCEELELRFPTGIRLVRSPAIHSRG